MVTRTVPAIVVLILSMALPATAQTPEGAVVGTVRSALDEPLPSASVELLSAADSSSITATLTTEGGRFRIADAAPGRYRVRVTLLGYAPTTTPEFSVSSGAEPVSIGVIRLETEAVALEGVEVTTQRGAITILADRAVYPTSEMAVAGGGTAVDVLRSIPELEVDLEGGVSSRGARPRIHINGRPAAMDGEALQRYLQQLPADRIDRVEVIPNPPARYEAEGTGGIVNIVMREGVDLGLSGSVSINANTQNRNGASGRLNFQEGRLTLFGGGNVSFYGADSEVSELRENLLATPVTLIQNEMEGRNDGYFLSLDLTAELKIGERGTGWAQARAHSNGMDVESTSAYLHMDADRHPIERYDRIGMAEYGSSSTMSVLGYRYAVQPQRNEWSVEVRRSYGGTLNDQRTDKYLFAPSGDPLHLPPETSRNENDEGVHELSLQSDLIRPLGEMGHFEVGFRTSRRDTDGDQTVEGLATTQPPGIGLDLNSFRYDERVHAGYITVDQRFGRFGAQVGVRAEQVNTSFGLPLDGRQWQNDYLALYPNVNLSASLGQGGQLRLSYSRRVERPSIWTLNPINRSADPLNLLIGNPDLRPRYTHSFTFDASRTGRFGSLRIAPFYRMTTDSWEQIRTVDENGVSTMSWYNASSNRSSGATASVSVREIGPLSGFIGVTLAHESRDASNLSPEYSRSATRVSTNSNVNVRATSTFSVQASINYMPGRDLPQGQISGTFFNTISARKQLLDQKATINLSIVDPLNQQRMTFTTRDRSHSQTATNNFSSRMVRLSIAYSFGRPPESGRRQGQPEETVEPMPVGTSPFP